jgi:integrase
MSERKSTKYEGVYFRERKALYNGRPDKTFEYCLQRNGRKVWETTGRASEGATLKGTYEARLNALAELHAGGLKKPAITFAEAFALLAKTFSTKAHKQIKGSLIKVHLLPAFGSMRLDELALNHLEDFKLELSKKLRPITISHIFILLKAAINYCIDHGRYEGVNILSTGKIKITGKNTRCERYFTKDEAKIILDGLEGTPWKDMGIVSLHTGVRLSELYKMRAADVHKETLTANITSKYGERQVLYLTEEAAALLKARVPNEEGLLFPKQPSRVFAAIVKKLGFNPPGTENKDKVWFHTFRHTFASWLVQADVNLYTVRRLMRHKSIAMTERYAHLSSDIGRHLDVIRRNSAGAF